MIKVKNISKIYKDKSSEQEVFSKLSLILIIQLHIALLVLQDQEKQHS